MLSLSYWSSCTHHTQDELDRVLLSEDTETIKQHLSGLTCISTSKLYKKVVSVYALPNWAKDILAVKWDIVVNAHLKGTSPHSSYFKKHLRYKFPVVKKGRAFDFLVNVLQVNIGSSGAENPTQSSRVSSSFKQNARWPKASLRPRLDIIAHLQKIDQDHLKLHLSVIQETPITSWCKIVCSRLTAPKWVDVHLNNALQNFKRNPHYEKLQGVHALYFKAKENETFVTAGQSYYVLNLLLRSEYDDEDTESDNDDCSIIDLRSKETNPSQQTEHECIDDSEDDNGSSSSSSSSLSNKNCMICKKDPWCMGCQDCELNLCEQCWQMLHTSPKISEHVRAEPLDCEHRICPSHPSMYVVALCTDASCSLSNKLMCALCDEHKSHSHMSLKSGYEFYTHKLGNQLKSTMATLQRVKRMKSQFESTNIIDDIKTKRHRITLLRSLLNRSEITRREESCNPNNAMIDARAENNIKLLHCGASKINNLFPTAQSALRTFIHAKTASTSRIAIFRDYAKFAKSLDDRPLIVETDHLHHSFVEYQKTPIPDNGWTIPNFSRLINVQPTQESECFAQLYGRILVTMFPEGVITGKPSIRFDFVDRRNINSTHWAYTFKLLVYVVHKNSSESISHMSSCAFTSTIARIDVSSRFIIDRILQDQEGFLRDDDKLDIDVVLQEDSLWNV